MLLDMKLDPAYDSDTNDCEDAKKHIKLFKKM